MSIDDKKKLMEILNDYLKNGTPEQQAQIVKWMVQYLSGGK